MSKLEALRKALEKNRYPNGSPESDYEIMWAIREELEAGGYYDAATSVRRSSYTLIPMFGGRGAQQAWDTERKALPWHRRLVTPRTMTEQYRWDWSKAETDKGRDIVHDALSGHTGATKTREEA